MTGLFGILITAVVTVVLGAVLKRANGEYRIFLSLAAVVLILLLVLEKAVPFIGQLQGLGAESAVTATYLPVMLKAVGITLAGQVTANICKDAGEQAIANVVEIAARVAILLVAMPLLTQVLGDIRQMLSLYG